jgi:hypothetical protein
MELKGTKNMLHDKGEGVIFSVEGLDEVSDAGEEIIKECQVAKEKKMEVLVFE